MFDGTSLSKSATLATVPFTGTVDTRTHWFDTLTARGGYLITPNVLLYAQGGAAWTNTDITFLNGAGTQIGEFSNNRTGWTAGGGVEWMFAPHWSVFAEYNLWALARAARRSHRVLAIVSSAPKRASKMRWSA